MIHRELYSVHNVNYVGNLNWLVQLENNGVRYFEKREEAIKFANQQKKELAKYKKIMKKLNRSNQ